MAKFPHIGGERGIVPDGRAIGITRRLEVHDPEPGDFIYVPPFVPHQEINASADEMLSCVVVRSGQEPIVVNVDIAPIEPPEEVYWVDPNHPHR